MNIEFRPTINGEPVRQVFNKHGVGIYTDLTDEEAFIVKENKVIAKITLIAYTGEGGGGSLEIEDLV